MVIDVQEHRLQQQVSPTGTAAPKARGSQPWCGGGGQTSAAPARPGRSAPSPAGSRRGCSAGRSRSAPPPPARRSAPRRNEPGRRRARARGAGGSTFICPNVPAVWRPVHHPRRRAPRSSEGSTRRPTADHPCVGGQNRHCGRCGWASPVPSVWRTWPTGPRRPPRNAAPEQVLAVLTGPEAIRTWSPVPFELDDDRAAGWRRGTRRGVNGRGCAGVRRGLRHHRLGWWPRATGALLSAGALVRWPNGANRPTQVREVRALLRRPLQMAPSRRTE